MEPKYKYKDKVKIYVNKHPKEITYPVCDGMIQPYDLEAVKIERVLVHGEIYIIDRGGTGSNGNREPSYDVMVESENMLYKHVTESEVYPDEEVQDEKNN